ncbi:MAG TPA: polyprenyl synthetase family protein [Solirubrobacteraceae bacterium]|nr:polyprenyl synthetase family protein [Solirubrobacteraceae bacterium]
MTTDPAVARVVDAGGDHVPPLLAAVEERLAAAASGHGAVLAEHAGATIAAGGKRLRPLLVVLVGGVESEALVRAATAVELVHAATLVHDDVLDAASLRRGRPTVVASGGRRMATATGDLLFSRAFAELALNEDAEQIRTLSRASSALARGELLQREDAFDASVTIDRYLLRCELKTAALFEAACELGALVAGRERAPLAAFGRRIGLAFQLLDDVLDITGPPERTGKHRGTDLLDGTITLPFILARERDPSLPSRPATPAEAESLCDRIAATGALEESRRRAMALVDEAKRELPDLPQRRALELVADGVVERYS